MKLVRGVAWAVIAIIAASLINVAVGSGMDHGVGLDTFLAGSKDPWQMMIGNDLVAGLLMTCAWIVFREKGGRAVDTVAWVWMALWWGNIVIAVYALVAAHQSGGDWARFFLGRRAGGPLVRAWQPSAPVRLASVACALATLAYLAVSLVGVRFAGLPTFGYVAAFVPVALSFALLARGGAER